MKWGVVALVVVWMLQGLTATAHVSLIGYLDDAGSISSHAQSFINCLSGKVDCTLYRTRKSVVGGLTSECKKVSRTSVDLKKNRPNNSLSGIVIYTDTVWWEGGKYVQLATKDAIRYAFCVTERTEIPSDWVKALNKNFDALLVPDQWLVDVYKNSGVRVPIYVLPLALDLKSMLMRTTKKKPHKPFTFGFSGIFLSRKNHILLMNAFAQEFGNDPHVELKIHGRYGSYFYHVLKAYEDLNQPNISLEKRVFSRNEYEDFLSSLDCFVTASMGEGFSIIPRECLAAGIPCIVSNNTAHKTICKTGFVYSLPSNIVEPSYYNIIEAYCGNHYNTSVAQLRKALRTVYESYQEYKDKAIQGRRWAAQYLPEALSQLYLGLIKPKKIILSRKCQLTQDCLWINSRVLFEKYKALYAKQGIICLSDGSYQDHKHFVPQAPWLSTKLLRKINLENV